VFLFWSRPVTLQSLSLRYVVRREAKFATAVSAVTVFVLRCWLEPLSSGADEWRASVYDPRNQQRRYFSDPRELSIFLTDLEPRTMLGFSDLNPRGATHEL